ncbi:GDSL-type esterase/lipase family protein [Kitasatospora sp. NPDC050543]|uniref:GDSL-type esterase/lipase family protein n=1 Tax=Kitasatospora sp. NPDC050543 TaxID=3364054 RepID=UPI00378E8341
MPATSQSAPPSVRPLADPPTPELPARRPGARPARRQLLLTAARLHTTLLMKRPPANWHVPSPDGRYGCAEGRPVPLLLLGDSLAQSLGVQAGEETMGALLANDLAGRTGRPVSLRVLARADATARSVQRQALRVSSLGSPGIAVVVIGGNDVMLPLPIGRSARLFARAVALLREARWEVVVVPCPDPGHAPGIRAVFRRLLSYRAGRLARLHTRAALRSGALIAPWSEHEFRDRAAELLSADGRHPSARGYAEHARRMLPGLSAAADRLHVSQALAIALPSAPAGED